jgi:trk system potassium uptake protein TrkH
MGVILMFIGGSPMGTAGGIKTVTFFVLIFNIYSFVLNREETVIFGRRVTDEAVRKATAIAMVHLSFMVMITLLLMWLNDTASFVDVLYEVASATSTVGVSRGFVLTLVDTEKLILVLAMYLGRIGPIAMLFFFKTDKENNSGGVKTANGRFIIG